MSKAIVLVIENDPDIVRSLSCNIQNGDYEFLTCTNGNTVLELVRQCRPHLVVLDLTVPGFSCSEFCRELKRGTQTRYIPIILITALEDEQNPAAWLDWADDYIIKPFSPKELALRIGVVLRRTPPKEVPVWHCEGLCVNFEAHRTELDGRETFLTPIEFKLLTELIRNPGKVRSRDQLLTNVWACKLGGDSRRVDTHVRRLRQKLGPYANWIETVRGGGYRFRD